MFRIQSTKNLWEIWNRGSGRKEIQGKQALQGIACHTRVAKNAGPDLEHMYDNTLTFSQQDDNVWYVPAGDRASRMPCHNSLQDTGTQLGRYVWL
jgi:hypothetical protein